MSKSKINPNAKSKLSSVVVEKQQEKKEDNLGFITPNKTKKATKSFRFSVIDLEKLRRLTDKTNKESMYNRYTESDIIRALILLGDKLQPKDIIRALGQRAK